MTWFWVKLNRYFNTRDNRSSITNLDKHLIWFKADKSFGEMTKDEHIKFISRVANKLFDNSQKK